MTPGLREHKQASLRVVVPDLPDDMKDGVMEIVELQSSNPRKGHATTLLWTVCSEADAARKVLILNPKRFGDGLDDDQLQRFYAKFGFKVFQLEPVVLMAREPEVRRRVVVQ